MTGQQLDPVSLCIALAGALFGPALAGIIGPYAVIILAATTGASWALGQQQAGTRGAMAWYFLRINATAVLVTVSCANLAGRWLGMEESAWLLAPIGLLIGGVGNDWPRLMQWLLIRLARLFERRTGTGSRKE